MAAAISMVVSDPEPGGNVYQLRPRVPQRPQCRHCLCTSPPMIRGLCYMCFGEEAEELPPEVRRDIDKQAVDACTAADLNVVEPERKAPTVHVRAARQTRFRTEVAFTPIDAKDLRVFFQKPMRTMRAERSRFGAMCERASAETNHQSEHKPTSTNALCPICNEPMKKTHRHKPIEKFGFAISPLRQYAIQVRGKPVQVSVYRGTTDPLAGPSERLTQKAGGDGVVSGSWDDEVAEYLDGTARMDAVRQRLQRMSSRQVAILEEFYAPLPAQELWSPQRVLGDLVRVAIWTRSLATLRAKRGEKFRLDADGNQVDGVESERDTLAYLVRRAEDGQAPKIERETCNNHLRAIAREARAMVDAAELAYATAACTEPR